MAGGGAVNGSPGGNAFTGGGPGGTDTGGGSSSGGGSGSSSDGIEIEGEAGTRAGAAAGAVRMEVDVPRTVEHKGEVRRSWRNAYW